MNLNVCFYEEDTQRMISSETYEVIDGFFKDMGTSSDHNDSWGGANKTVVRSATETTVTRPSDATGNAFHTLGSLSSPFAIEFDYLQNNTNTMTSLRKASTVIKWLNYTDITNLNANEWYHWIIKVTGTTIKMTVDGVSRTFNLSDVPNAWSMRVQTDEMLQYKNFVVYPI